MRLIFFLSFFLILPVFSFAKSDEVKSQKTNASKISNYFKKHSIDIFPVPVYERRPDKGNSFGLMPIMLLSDEKNAIKAILGGIGQYNTVTKVDGGVLAYFYPEPEQEILIYGEVAQRYAREASFRFFDPHIFDHFYLEFDFIYLKTPFGHFFGIGPTRAESDRSNYVSRNFITKLTAGYYLFENIRANLGLRFRTTDVLSRAMTQYADTLTRYGNLPNVIDSTNLTEEVSLVFDNRPEGIYSKKGSLAKLAFFISNKNLGSDKSFLGWNLEASHLLPILSNKWSMALRFNFQELFGDNVPFYELSSLGGPNELRAFTPLRFVDQGKILFQMEQRIKLFGWKLFGIPFDIHTDPFFELGRVFDSSDHLGFNRWQPVGGLGFRLFVPPNVTGRVDLAYGTDGVEIYTVLGYPF